MIDINVYLAYGIQVEKEPPYKFIPGSTVVQIADLPEELECLPVGNQVTGEHHGHFIAVKASIIQVSGRGEHDYISGIWKCETNQDMVYKQILADNYWEHIQDLNPIFPIGRYVITWVS